MRMSEDQIEFIVEKTMDKLDSQLVKHTISLEQYDAEVAKLDEWSRTEIRNLTR